MSILSKAKLEALAFKIGGGILGGIGIIIMSRGFIRDGMIQGIKDSVMTNKVRELEGMVDDPLMEYFEENIEI